MTEQRPSIQDAALEILRKTDDGDKLSPTDLKLLEQIHPNGSRFGIPILAEH